MQTDDKIRRYYYKYTKGGRSNAKSPSINSNWGYCFLLVGVSFGILFSALMLQDGFNNIVLVSIGIFSLLLVIIGVIILINND